MSNEPDLPAEKVAFHAARVETHIGGPNLRCACGWSVTLPTALAAINAYGDHRAAAAVALTPPGKTPPLPLHRTEAGYPNCSTCDGSGCLDCTDPA